MAKRGSYEIIEALDSLAVKLAKEFNECVVFKGGYINLKRFPEVARATTDMDIDLTKVNLYDELEACICDWAEGLKAEGKITECLCEKPSEGRTGNVKLMSNGDTFVSVDICADGSYSAITQFQLGDYAVTTTTLEQVLADKLSAFASAKRFRRVKDLYDIWCILTKAEVNTSELFRILTKTKGFKVEEPEPFSDESLLKLRRAYSKFNVITQNYSYNTEYVKRAMPEFDDVITMLLAFIDMTLEAAQNQKESDIIWRVKGQ